MAPSDVHPALAHPNLTFDHHKHTDNSTHPDSASITRLNRESAVALGILLLLILVAISWFSTSRIRRHKTALRQAEAYRLSVSANCHLSPSTGGQVADGITGYRIFKVDRDVSRKGWEDWAGRESEACRRGESMATLPRYEERNRRNDGVVLSEKERQRRWWGSVAAHGTTTKADVELPPLSPGPTLENLTYPTPMRAPVAGRFRTDIWEDRRGQSSVEQESVGGSSSCNDKIKSWMGQGPWPKDEGDDDRLGNSDVPRCKGCCHKFRSEA